MTSISPDLRLPPLCSSFFFFTDPATSAAYTLSLHDALPIFRRPADAHQVAAQLGQVRCGHAAEMSIPSQQWLDRKSIRLNSSHSQISYAVFCLKKKKRLLRVGCRDSYEPLSRARTGPSGGDD